MGHQESKCGFTLCAQFLSFVKKNIYCLIDVLVCLILSRCSVVSISPLISKIVIMPFTILSFFLWFNWCGYIYTRIGLQVKWQKRYINLYPILKYNFNSHTNTECFLNAALVLSRWGRCNSICICFGTFGFLFASFLLMGMFGAGLHPSSTTHTSR